MNKRIYIGSIAFFIIIYLLNAIRSGFYARNLIETFIATIIFFVIMYLFRMKK